MVANKADMVRALHSIGYFKGPIVTHWRGRRLWMETTTRRGPLSTVAIERERAAHGIFCLEWLPFLVLSELRLLSEAGGKVNPNTRFRLVCRAGTQLKDVVHWRWTPAGNLLVTALLPRLTAEARRQVSSLMTLLVLNFPQLIYPGCHSGGVRYITAAAGHIPIQRRLNEDGRLEGTDNVGRGGTVSPVIETHRQLVECMQKEVGETPVLRSVHPHPRLSRMACLWAGNRRWKSSRKEYKSLLAAKQHTKGLRLCAGKQEQWRSISVAAANGLAGVTWTKIRRITGLNPWGEQLLLRVKHHAISVFNPVTAGLNCPHQACIRAGRVDLHHVFWTCPAAKTLRRVLLQRWRAAGLRTEKMEEAIFGLQLPETPIGLTVATGQLLAESAEDILVALGDAVERLASACWSLGAALYLLAVWRWRVAYFDPLNDTSMTHHTASLATSLRHGYADIMRDIPIAVGDKLRQRLSRTMCEVLGAAGPISPENHQDGASCFLVLFAGGAAGTPSCSGSGTLIVQVHRNTGSAKVKYICGSSHAGAKVAPLLAAQLGLLRGMRICHRYGWTPVHVVGDNAAIVRRHAARLPPKVQRLAANYWKTRRMADAVRVLSWTTAAREHNRTARELERLARTTGTGVEWNEQHCSSDKGKWAAIINLAHADVQQWIHLTGETDFPETAADTV